MPTRSQLSKEVMEREIPCSSKDCPVVTKVLLPKNFDVSQSFCCGFCNAVKITEPKSYANILVDNLTKENKARSCIAREIRHEQLQQDSKRMNVIIKGSVPSNGSNDLDLVKQIAEEIDVTLNKTDFEPKRIGSINESTGRQLLLVKFQSDIKRKEFLRKSKNLRSSNDFSQIYVDPDLTKSEREAKFQVRQERRTLQNKYPGKTFVIRSGRVQEKK